MTAEFENLVRLLECKEKANIALAYQLAPHYAEEFEAYFGYNLEEYKLIKQVLPDADVKNVTLQWFAHKYLSMYDFRFEESEQCGGWKHLKSYVETQNCPPEYGSGLHAVLIPYILKGGWWEFLKILKIAQNLPLESIVFKR
jgi:hypothetical protein